MREPLSHWLNKLDSSAERKISDAAKTDNQIRPTNHGVAGAKQDEMSTAGHSVPFGQQYADGELRCRLDSAFDSYPAVCHSWQ
jgi:hypothetical protein